MNNLNSTTKDLMMHQMHFKYHITKIKKPKSKFLIHVSIPIKRGIYFIVVKKHAIWAT